jgi:hypothetical protein
MKYLIALVVTSLALIMPPVIAADAAPTAQSAPVQKGKLKLAKKKDHSKADAPKKKSKK